MFRHYQVDIWFGMLEVFSWRFLAINDTCKILIVYFGILLNKGRNPAIGYLMLLKYPGIKAGC